MNKTILITGASSGIGAATARTAVAAGYRVVLLARSADKLSSLAAELGPKAVAVAGDVTKQADVERAVQTAVERFGGVDAAFANAGLFYQSDLANGDPDEWARMIDVNIVGVLRTVRAVLPGMIERGSGDILFTGSIAGRVVFPRGAAYGATKHAVYAIAEGLRKEVCKNGIRVAVLSPGYVANEIWGITDPAQIAALETSGDALTSQNIADAVVHLLSMPANVNIADMLVLPTRLDVPSL